MKKLLLLPFLFLFFNISAQDYLWTRTNGGSVSEAGLDIALDLNGMPNIVGFFTGAVDFDPGLGSEIRASNGETDIFIRVLNAAGELRWVKTIGGLQHDIAKGVGVQGQTINIVGSFMDSVDFNPGGIPKIVESNGSTDIFVLRLDDTGGFVWLYTIGGPGEDVAESVWLDGGGNLLVVGSFSDSVDFNPDGNPMMRYSNGASDIFFLKLGWSVAQVHYAHTFGGPGFDFGRHVTADVLANAYCIGYFRDSMDIHPLSQITEMRYSNGMDDVFVMKLGGAGQYLWGNTFGGPSLDIGYAITLVPNGIAAVGSFMDSCDFDPDTTVNVYHSAGKSDVFINYLDPDGNYEGTKTFGGTEFEEPFDAVFDVARADLYLAGYFEGVSDFDPGPGVANVSSNGLGDFFVQKLDDTGAFEWVHTARGIGFDQATGLALGFAQDAYVTGSVVETVNFASGLGTDNHTAVGLQDIFTTKMGTETVVGVDEPKYSAVNVFPNPSTHLFTVELDDIFSSGVVEVMTIAGQMIYRNTFHHERLVDIKIPGPTGIYFIRLTNFNGAQAILKVVKE